jgi:hypothetical protein
VRAWRPVTGGGSEVAQTGSLLCRRLATGGPADCQSAKRQVANLRYVPATGQGARRAGEEAIIGEATGYHRELASPQPGQFSNSPGCHSNEPGMFSNDVGNSSKDPGGLPNDEGYLSNDDGCRSNDPGERSDDSGERSNDPGMFSNDAGDSSNEPGEFSNEPGDSSKDAGEFSNEPGVPSNDPGEPSTLHVQPPACAGRPETRQPSPKTGQSRLSPEPWRWGVCCRNAQTSAGTSAAMFRSPTRPAWLRSQAGRAGHRGSDALPDHG